MNLKSLFIFVYPILTCMPLAGMAKNSDTLPDSLLTRDHIYTYTFSDTTKAKQIISLMRERKLAPDHVLDIAHGDLLFNNGRYNAALGFYRKALLSDSVKNNNEEYMDQLHRMISCYDCLHDEQMKSHYVKELLHKAEACGNKAMQSVALFNMGKMIYYQESTERGYTMIGDAIRLMEESDYKYKYDNLRYNYNSLFIMQQRDKLYEKALDTLKELERVVHTSTEQEPEIKELNEKELKTLYANRAVILSRLGRPTEADEAYNLWKNTATFYTKDDYLIGPYLIDRRMNDEVIRIYSAREKFLRQNKDTVNYHMMTIKRALGNSYAGKHDYRRAATYFRELAVVTDSLKVREQQSAALELAEVYKTNEQAALLKEQEADLRLRETTIFFTIALLAVAAVFLFRVVRYNRTIKKKNQAMSVTINKLMAYKDEAFARQEENIRLKDRMNEMLRTHETESPSPEDTGTDAPDDDAEKETEAASALTEKDRLLFDRMTHTIVSRRLYLQPDFNRKEFMKELHIPTNKFSLLFKELGGCSFSQYIQELRLDHAVRLMGENPHWSLDSIARESQMSKSAFYDQFQKRYGMKPREYCEKEFLKK